MTVGELLSKIDAHELAEWEAFEVVNGPIGREYSDDMLACIHEVIQLGNYIQGFQYTDNPVPKPSRVTRPNKFVRRTVEFQDGEIRPRTTEEEESPPEEDPELSLEEFIQLF